MELQSHNLDSSRVLEEMAELMPIKSPFTFTKAPPEFPGLIAASV